MSNLDRLGELLDAPLLVTNLTNVFYLTGFDSSNAALLVRPGGEATLYTDFRYIETARDVPGVDAQLAKRTLMADIGERLTGRVQFEADVLPYLEWERLAAGKAKLEPTTGVVDALRAVKSSPGPRALPIARSRR
jgi:Xaa-Pro aminopeptidase